MKYLYYLLFLCCIFSECRSAATLVEPKYYKKDIQNIINLSARDFDFYMDTLQENVANFPLKLDVLQHIFFEREKRGYRNTTESVQKCLTKIPTDSLKVVFIDSFQKIIYKQLDLKIYLAKERIHASYWANSRTKAQKIDASNQITSYLGLLDTGYENIAQSMCDWSDLCISYGEVSRNLYFRKDDRKKLDSLYRQVLGFNFYAFKNKNYAKHIFNNYRTAVDGILDCREGDIKSLLDAAIILSDKLDCFQWHRLEQMVKQMGQKVSNPYGAEPCDPLFILPIKKIILPLLDTIQINVGTHIN